MGTSELRPVSCRGADCHAQILLVATAKSVMPLDAAPAGDGKIRIFFNDNIPYADVIDDPTVREMLYPGETWYRPHWASCPNADQFRSKP